MDRNGTPHIEPGALDKEPLPYSKHLDRGEYDAALALLHALEQGATYPDGVHLRNGTGGFADFTFVEVRDLHRTDVQLVVGLPSREDRWEDSFYFAVMQPRWARRGAATKQ